MTCTWKGGRVGSYHAIDIAELYPVEDGSLRSNRRFRIQQETKPRRNHEEE